MRRMLATLTVAGAVAVGGFGVVLGDVASAADLPVPVTTPADPILAALDLPADATTKGVFSEPIAWPLLPIHAALMPDGSLVTYGTPPDAETQMGRVLDVWNPDEGTAPLAHLLIPNAGATDSFCSLAVLMPSGEYLMAGGNTPLGSAVYDYKSHSARAAAQLHQSRWYGTMTMLPDGRALVSGGTEPYLYNLATGAQADQLVAENRVGITPEVYDPVGGWTLLTGATSRAAFGPELNKWWYPRQWVAPDGRVFGITGDTMYYLDTAGTGSTTIVGTFKAAAPDPAAADAPRPNIGATSTAVMYAPGKILQVGGNGYHDSYPSNSSALATIVDINGPTPTLTETAAMRWGRQWSTGDRTPDRLGVSSSGGSRFSNSGADAALEAEMWGPEFGHVEHDGDGRLQPALPLDLRAVCRAAPSSPPGRARRGPSFQQETPRSSTRRTCSPRRPTARRCWPNRPRVTPREQRGGGLRLGVRAAAGRPDDRHRVRLVDRPWAPPPTAFDMGQRRLTVPFTQTGDRVVATIAGQRQPGASRVLPGVGRRLERRALDGRDRRHRHGPDRGDRAHRSADRLGLDDHAGRAGHRRTECRHERPPNRSR